MRSGGCDCQPVSGQEKVLNTSVNKSERTCLERIATYITPNYSLSFHVLFHASVAYYTAVSCVSMSWPHPV